MLDWSYFILPVKIVSSFLSGTGECAVAEKTPRGSGVLKVEILEAKYEAKLEFPVGMGVQNKTPCGGSMGIF